MNEVIKNNTITRRISNWIFTIALFTITNLEWNSFDVYTKFLPFDYLSLLAIIFICSGLYINKDIISRKSTVVILTSEILVIFTSIFIFHNMVILIFLSVIIISLFLIINIEFTKSVSMIVSIWMSVFFYYWTFDVKGYFKGYDVFYGSIILFVGFIYSFIVIELLKYYIKTKYCGENKVLVFFKRNDFLIGFIQVALVIWAYSIMSWYQSKVTFFVTLIFVILIVLPEEISALSVCHKIAKAVNKHKEIEYKYNYFCNMILSAVIAYTCMLIVAIYNKCTLAISAPFILAFISLFGIYRYVSASKLGENYHVFDLKEHREYIKKNGLNNALLCAISSLTVIIPIGILAPVENYYSNIRELPFSIKDFMGTFITYSLTIAVSFLVIGSVLRKPSIKALCTLLFSFGVATYTQVMVLNRKLSESDGSALDFDSLGNYITISFIIWISIIIAICFILILVKEKWRKVILFGGIGLCIVQLVAAISLPITNKNKNIAKSETYELSARNKFEVASDENIIIFVLDTIGNVQLENAVNEFPYILDDLDDFTYYCNADCVYAWTYPSLTYMLTGNELDTENDWLKESWNNSKTKAYYDTLHEAGYSVYMYTNYLNYVFGGGENLVGKFDNIHKYKHFVDKKLVKQKMLRYALFKTLPYKFKPRFEILTNDLKFLDTILCDEGDSVSNADTYEFYEQLSNGISVNESEKKAIRIFHLDGTHYPFEINENFEKDSNTTRNQVVCANMQLVKMYIEQLKGKDLYDGSSIFIMADHGTYIDIADPQPIVFVKYKKQESNSLVVSDAPISHTEFMATLLDAAEINYEKYGKAYKDIAENEIRERTVGYLSEDKSYYSFYKYCGNKNDLLKIFPHNPDYEISAW